MRRPKSSHRRGGGGRGARFYSAVKYCLLFCGLPLALLMYAVVGWRAWNRRGGPIESAARGGCFGTQVRGEERRGERWRLSTRTAFNAPYPDRSSPYARGRVLAVDYYTYRGWRWMHARPAFARFKRATVRSVNSSIPTGSIHAA